MAGMKKVESDIEDIADVAPLGSHRMRNVDTNEIILIPTPSNDPNDPLNWLVESRC